MATGDGRAGWDLRAVPQVVVAGLLGGIVTMSIAIALAALIFGPGLTDTLPAGIGTLLVGGAVMAAVGALLGALPGTVIGPQDAPASVLAAAGAALVAGQATRPGDTLLALAIVSTAVLGVALLLLGWLDLGRLIRFLPFPVMAGFMGGVGFTLIDSSVRLLVAGTAVADLLAVDPLVRLMPALALAGLLSVAFRAGGAGRSLLPSVLVGAILCVHLARALAGVGVDEAVRRGWLLGPIPDGRLWSPGTLDVLTTADWSAVAGQAGTVAVLLLLVPVSVLLYTGGLEQEFQQDLPADRELRTMGAANLLAALTGSSPGYVHFSSSVMTNRLAEPHRGAGLVVAAVMLAAAMAGGTVISLVPVPVVGGILLFIGGQFVLDWLWRIRWRVSAVELAVMVAIATVTATLGFVPGISLGIALAVALFVVRYSRLGVVRTALSGRVRRSNVQRPLREEVVLDREGERIHVLELDGFLFFGSAEGILDAVRRRLASTDPALGWLVLDLHRVSGLDSTAVGALVRLARMAADHGFAVALCGVDPSARTGLRADITEAAPGLEVAPDVDRALQRCEDELLAAHAPDGGGDDAPFAAVFGAAASALLPHLTVHRLPAGTRLLQQGEESPGLYFLETGRASILLARDGSDQEARIRQVMEGTIVGEISYYLEGPCTASVELDTDAVVRRLDRDTLRSLQERHPDLTIALHQAMARTLAQRLVQSNATISELLR